MDNVSVMPAQRMPFHLLEEITDGFSEDRKLGVDEYGTVYMGAHRDGKKIVVKVPHDITGLDDPDSQEYHNLTSIRHKNIVQLVGYCYETTQEPVMYKGRMVFAETTRRVLCFEYMPNRSLSNYLSDESKGNDWCTRYAIIKGISEGLKYLHEKIGSRIYHLDLKPENILLDEKLVPKITGFNLSRLFRGEQYQITRSIVGSGYLPPEYIGNGLISNKLNIFSLGVIMIKIMTGRGYFRSVEMSSRKFIKNVHCNWTKRLQETFANKLQSYPFFRFELESYCKQVKTCAEIALSCVEADRHKRPSIRDVVNKLTETETMAQLHGEFGYVLNPPSTAASVPPSAPAPAPTQTLEPKPPTPHLTSVRSSYTRTPSSSPVAAADQNIGTEIIGSLSASQVRPEEISGPEQPSPGLPSSRTPSSSGLPSSMRPEAHHLWSLTHLKDITKNFSEERILGKGGSGVVYKGVLANGKMIAVKKIEQRWSSMEQCELLQKQFENEVNLLMGLKHPNIVELLGYCYEMHHEHLLHDEKYIFCWQIDSLLCLEFLSGGSLHNHISDATSGLDWHTRYKIIEGISYGVQYIHEQSVVPIIHLDLKPGNILLDANMVPKIADFGISRQFDKGQTIHTTKTSYGTLGYMPPEFVQAGTITLMSDIFSLGVIIMEVITGHKDYPVDLKASSEKFINVELSKWRSKLEKEPGNTSLETDCQQIEKCIQIGLICVNPDRTKRPTMRKIIGILQGLESSTTREYGPLLERNILGRRAE